MPTEPAPPVTIRVAVAFERQLKRLKKKYRRIRTDLQPVLDELSTGATPGNQISGTGYTVYKVRIANSDARRGLSGGYRVIYYVETPTVRLLVAIYSKTEQGDIAADDIKRFIKEELTR